MAPLVIFTVKALLFRHFEGSGFRVMGSNPTWLPVMFTTCTEKSSGSNFYLVACNVYQVHSMDRVISRYRFL